MSYNYDEHNKPIWLAFRNLHSRETFFDESCLGSTDYNNM